jgi:exosortase
MPAIIGLYWPTFEVLAKRWTQWDMGMSHGLLVAAVFIWLLWVRPCHALPRKHFALRAVLVGLMSLLWFVVQSVRINVLAEVALLLTTILAYTAWLGFEQSWRYKAVLLLPLFATSLWGELNSSALYLSSFMVGHMVEAAGITAHIDGATISLPYGQILIAHGCSGLRYIVIALALGHMLACLNHYTTRAYWTTLLVALLLGLATNWIRIFILILLGYFTQMQSSLVADHETFGWLLFAGVALPPLYFAPVRAAARTAVEHYSPPLRHLFAVLCVLCLGPLLLLFSQRTPAPATWLPPLPVAASPLPQWAVATPMPPAGLAEEGLIGSVWVQRWQYQRTQAKDKLVPFLGDWHPDIPCTPKNITPQAAGAWFECRLDDHPVLVLRRFTVGRFVTAEFRQAKLLQLPAQWTGDNLFSLTQWQHPCDEPSCTQAAQQISAQAGHE